MSGLGKELADAAGYGSVGETGTIELDDGKALRVKLEPDYDTSVSDFPDLYGIFEPVQRWDRDGCRAGRPDGFDGNAEKIWIGRSEQVWWQPPKDIKRTDPNFSHLRDEVREIGEFGFMVVVVELLEGKDHYGDGIVRDSTCLGGVEGNADHDYLATVIEDMLSELDHNFEVAEATA